MENTRLISGQAIVWPRPNSATIAAIASAFRKLVKLALAMFALMLIATLWLLVASYGGVGQ